MARKYRSRTVNYWVTEPVEIEPGVTLPVGRYTGLMEEHGYETFQGVSWTKPRYGLELSAQRLATMGRQNQRDLDSVSYDLAKFIGAGEIEVG
jgi:hypothetical protein